MTHWGRNTTAQFEGRFASVGQSTVLNGTSLVEPKEIALLTEPMNAVEIELTDARPLSSKAHLCPAWLA